MLLLGNASHPTTSRAGGINLDASTPSAKCHALSVKLLESFAISMGLAPSFFSSAHSPANPPGNVLRLIQYPALAKQPDPSIPRLGEHTHWGTLTLFVCEDGGVGSQEPESRLGCSAGGATCDNCQYRGWTRVMEWEDVEVNLTSAVVE